VLIQALCEYYDTLSEQGKLTPEGYSSVKISYLISLTPDGGIDGILDARTVSTIKSAGGKEKEIKTPILLIMPKRTEKPGIEANIAEHRPLYIFGLNYDATTGALSASDRTGKAKKSHEAFVEKSKAFFDGMKSPVVNAFLKFVDFWVPENETDNPFLIGLGKELATAGFAFILSGHPELLLHDDSELKAKWELQADNDDTGQVLQQCGITGQVLPAARIHDKIKGVPGGSSMGNTLISFNNPSEYSYGHEQSYNSNISQVAMKKYTQALNYLMASKKHRNKIGDDFVIFHWATSNDESCDDLYEFLMFGADNWDAEKTDHEMHELVSKIASGGVWMDEDTWLENVDPNVSFYVAGMKPNSARLAVKFVYRCRFGELFHNLMQHQKDLQISPDGKTIPMYRIMKELISPQSSSSNVDPALTEKLLNAVMNGYRYPGFLMQTVVHRIQVDNDAEDNSYIKMNDTRMGILKACINRDDRLSGKEEEIKMALDKENKNAAYLCGRLFAVLENIQQKASGYDLNRTIKDAYFTSASTRPATVFPRLLTLAQHHMAKLENDRYADENIREIVDQMGSEFPVILSLKEQGIFMLGYYQQKQYTKDQINAYKEEK
jgi:CRISPR-associated protein Csd1